MSLRRHVLLLAQLSLCLTMLHAQDSHVIPRAEESQQIPGPQCDFVPDEDAARARLCTPAAQSTRSDMGHPSICCRDRALKAR